MLVGVGWFCADACQAVNACGMDLTDHGVSSIFGLHLGRFDAKEDLTRIINCPCVTVSGYDNGNRRVTCCWFFAAL